MATIKEATDKFSKEFILLKGVYGVGHFPCNCCDKPFIQVMVDKNIDKEILNKIPNKYMGFRVEKKQGQQAVALTNTTSQTSKTENDKFKKEFEDKDSYVIDITKKGKSAMMKAPITGGYIPEDINILIDVIQKPKTIADLKNGVRKYEHLEGLLIYLHTKGLISINGITSKNAENYSNARGRRPAPRRRVVVRRSLPRRGRRIGYYGVYPFAVLPATSYYYNVGRPNRIKITNRGLKYLALNTETNIYTYFLSAVASGLIYDERNLVNTLKLGNNYNKVAGWLYGNKLITFA